MPSSWQSRSRESSSGGHARRTSRLDGVRSGIQGLFSRRSSVGPGTSTPDSPKSPRFVLGLPNLSSTRLNVPCLNRTLTVPRRSNTGRSNNSPTPWLAGSPTSPESLRQYIQHPPVSVAPSHPRRHSVRRFVGVDPAELRLAELAYTGRGRRRHKRGIRERRFAPKTKNRKIRAKILSSFVSGLFLTLILTIYLALALSNRDESQEFHILLILIILITTVFFCHSLIRLCMILVHPPRDDDLEQQLSSMTGLGGYANPATPIPVALARDEEAVGIESDATKFPPPAYGLWRESVRVDPNRIFWQRNEAAALEQQHCVNRDERPATASRPPSYISEDGVDYVVEAAPRSTIDVPLPPHPSERASDCMN